ncbi:UNC-50-like protein [Coniophora puteana RWD-64-598 SS2]|uniref:UNC-50-like protein n=1 Tax=Coniophora puteana (strain RWD-64-598) TaxID=741705 RepID=R7SF30_CONPW|nr:UNC-50-like protein [Coniophora puteana RWD-64-598 SS2]EIW74352.1 UNC-50-like protein [Coniophora puteana RWD-64-598 SS2]
MYPSHQHSLSDAGPTTVSNRVPLIFRRLHRFQQMDFELAFWQLTYLCLAPRRVYKNVYYHKQTKNTWARDDPAILVLLLGALVGASVGWSIAYSLAPLDALRVVLLMIVRDYLLVGALMATIVWFFANRVLVSPSNHSSPTDSSVEWAYAFDVHTNAFFPFYLTLYIAQLLLLPVVLRDNWVCLWVGNTLYLVGFAQYVYGIYLGLNALPFLIRTEILLSPLLPLFASYVLSLLGFNVAKNALHAYFGS